jgi:hypothetical protein
VPVFTVREVVNSPAAIATSTARAASVASAPTAIPHRRLSDSTGSEGTKSKTTFRTGGIDAASVFNGT